ncbi:MAG TPA: hypothetical protein VEV84_06620 [Pyrinomonadaceae bacterium]|nr:hypothetical protein [Pyrinomonadaceae bacterium]
MKIKNTFFATATFAMLLLSAQVSIAQVERVQMHIAGYLCGN